MAVPVIQGVGPKGNGTGNVQYLFTGVSYQLNDIGLLFIETANAATISVDQGWTQVSSSPQSSTATILHLYWKRLSASETGPTATQGGTTNHQCGGIIVIRGCIETGNPWNITNGTIETASDTSVSVPGGTTTIAECLVLAATSDQTDSASAQGTGTPANADLTSVAYTVLNYNTNNGNGGGVVVMKGEKASAGTYGASSMTLVTASDKGLINIALKPPPPSWDYSGAIDLPLTPGSTYLQGFAYLGNITASFTPGSTYFADYPYSGAIISSLAPGAVYTMDHPPYAGAIGLSLTPGSTYLQEWLYTGAILLELIPGSAYEYVGVSAWEYSGNVAFSLTPGSTFFANYPFTGTILCVLIPGAIYTNDPPAYAGAILVSILPASSFFAIYIFGGGISLNFVPNSTYQYQGGGFDWIGDVVFNLSPQSTYVPGFAFLAGIGVSLSPASIYLYELIFIPDTQSPTISFFLSAETELWRTILVPASSIYGYERIEERPVEGLPEDGYVYLQEMIK
jgi:hypothetical protein